MRTEFRKWKKLLVICLAAVMTLSGSTSAALASRGDIFWGSGDDAVGPIPDSSVFSELKRNGIEPAAKKTNTVMIYMVGADLESRAEDEGGGNATKDLQEMMRAGLDPSVSNVLVYTGGCTFWHSNVPNDRNMVYLIGDKTAKAVSSTESLSDTGDPRSLADFINFATEYFPAEHYGLQFWDHAGGPVMGFGEDENYGAIEYSVDAVMSDGLKVAELREAMEDTVFSKGKKLDYVFFDTCLIASVEVAKMWQPYADTFVASEESVPGLGMDYSYLKELNTKNLSQIAPVIVNGYGSFYEYVNSVRSAQGYEPVDYTMSAMDLQKTDKVAAAIDALFSKAVEGLRSGEFGDLQRAREMMYEFAPEKAGQQDCFDVVDCVDMAEQMKTLYPQEAKQLQDAVSEAIISEAKNVSRAHGLMMYYPQHGIIIEKLLAPEIYEKIAVSEAYKEYLDMVSQAKDQGNPDLWVGTSPKPTTAPATPTPTAAPTSTPKPTAAPTATPKPTTAPTSTPKPTAAPTSTPKPTASPAPTTPKPTATPAPTTAPTTPTPTTPTPTPPPVTAATGDAVTWQIPDKNWTQVTFTICKSEGNGVYRPILLDVPATPDASGKVVVSNDQKVLCMESDVTSEAEPWTATELSREGNKVKYRISGTTLASGPEFTSVTDDGQPTVVIIATADTNAGEAKIQSIRPVQEKIGPIGFDDYDPEDWEGIYEYLFRFQPGVNSDGTCTPVREWTQTNEVLFRMFPIDDRIIFVQRPVVELAGDYVVVFQEKTSTGKLLCSGLMEYPKDASRNPQKKTVSAGAGTFTVSMYSDHAEIIGYEGNDTALTIPADIDGVPVTAIGNRALTSAAAAEELVISEGVISIGEYACAAMTSLKKVTLPKSLKKIEYKAFYGDGALISVEIPEGTEKIGRAAFQDCTLLKEVTIPGSITEFGRAVFAGCESLVQIHLTNGSACKLEGNLILSADGKTLLAVPEGAGTYVKVPDGVETVGYGAFSGSLKIKKVDMPAGLKRIENYAFYNCTQLIAIELPDSVEYIGTKAFGSSAMAFMGDYERAKVSRIRIGAEARNIGTNVFNGLDLTAFEVAEENRSWAAKDGFLTNKAGDMLWEAPAGLSGTVTVPHGITTLRENVFADNINITDIVLPDSVVTIPEHCFPVDSYETVNGESKPVYKITLHCSADSAAAAYAEKYGIPHVE